MLEEKKLMKKKLFFMLFLSYIALTMNEREKERERHNILYTYFFKKNSTPFHMYRENLSFKLEALRCDIAFNILHY